ncbi:hypothetical protein CTA1_2156 [Colletotrichum tanaceti]|uniref:Uncharacterized protein n=1 Tax=Colletotrichum tanaceti TaxID=1306861 RepID=A0A4U6XNJ1_9PEZI|nr:hypothetical protein CTA1_2156 [Colletotrichum tanaceti]
MGILKFFSSKRLSDKPSNGIKVQAYDATIASLPPLLGTYPVAGNGPTNVFENLQRSHHKMSETSLSLAAGSDTTAPAPPVPRIRDAGVERPSSAPGSAMLDASPSGRTGRDSSKGSLLSLRKPRVGSVTSTTSGLSPTPKRRTNSSAVPFEGDPFRPPAAPFSHFRHFSLQNTGVAARGFIDLLDAQSEIKPSGFQSRVKASGVRDYGEDVADRNIGENGVDLTSERVRAFYASTSTPRTQYTGVFASPSARGSPMDKHERFQPPRRLHSLDTEGRTKSLTTSSAQVPFRTNMFNPESSLSREPIMESVAESVRVRRRQSLGAYIPVTPSILAADRRPLDAHRPTADTDGPRRVRQHKRRSTLSGEAPSNELGIFSASGGANAESSPSSTTPPKPANLAKHNYSLPVQQRPKTSGHNPVESYHAARPPSRGGSVASSTFSSPTQKSPSQQHTLSATGAAARHTERPQSAMPDRGSGTRGWVGRVEVEGFVDSADVASPAPSPHVMRSGHSWRETLDDSCQRPNTHGSPYGKGKLDEIYEHVPLRGSSLHQWSASSATPTISSTSSFPRPHSRHTTTTSVDLATMSSFMNDSHSSLFSSGTGDHASFRTALESALPSPLHLAASGGGFNIDDYLSSDDDIDADSFITTRKRDSAQSGGHEDELLFSDKGYGEGGLQLPGLFDSLCNVPDPDTTSPERPGLRYSHSSNTSRFAKRLSLDPWIEAPTLPLGEEEEEEDDDDIYGIPMRSDLALGRRGTRRISALGTLYQSIEEEKEDKVDVRTAVRLRKEAKARLRAMPRRSKSQQRRPDDAEEKRRGW